MLLLHCLTFEKKMHNVPAGHHTNVLGINLLVINTSNRRWRLLAQRASHPFTMPFYHVYIYVQTDQWKRQRFHPCHLSLICVSLIFICLLANLITLNTLSAFREYWTAYWYFAKIIIFYWWYEQIQCKITSEQTFADRVLFICWK